MDVKTSQHLLLVSRGQLRPCLSSSPNLQTAQTFSLFASEYFYA